MFSEDIIGSVEILSRGVVGMADGALESKTDGLKGGGLI